MGQNEEGCWQRPGELSVQNSKEDNPKAGGQSGVFIGVILWSHLIQISRKRL